MLKEETIKIIADIAIMASSLGMSKHALAMYNAIDILKPDSIFQDIGIALDYMGRKNNSTALEILEKKALKKSPEDSTIHTLIAMAYMLDGNNAKSEKILYRILKNYGTEDITMAKEILKQIQLET